MGKYNGMDVGAWKAEQNRFGEWTLTVYPTDESRKRGGTSTTLTQGNHCRVRRWRSEAGARAAARREFPEAREIAS